VAVTDSTVLIFGESGTGKELAARAVHLNSPRASKPFVAINCANLSDTLLESELFGYEKGAFTGAYAQKKGKLETAENGTLFLDEVSEFPIALQARLLRVLQEREFERLGSNRTIRINIRIIAATNQDLEAAVQKGNFRKDLYYRLNVVTISMPPLRERPEDTALLASCFISKFAKKCGRNLKGLSPDVRRCFFKYHWPGNVRQLENVIERAVVLGSEDQILLEDLPDEILESFETSTNRYQELLKQAKKKIMSQALENANGNIVRASELLGMHPNNFHRLMKNLKLK
jgi:two-component system, NtrC family, response regulator HydG